MPKQVMSRDGTRILDGPESARQRLRDALATPRGNYPFARNYGSDLGDLVDRNVDTAYAARIYAGVAGAIAHPPNGLEDIALQEVRLHQDDDLVEIEVLAEWRGEGGTLTPIGVRQGLLPPAADTPNRPATGAPTILGTARVGEELRATPGTIEDPDGLEGALYAYQWLRDGAEIPGATGETYDLVAADEGARLSVRATFADDRNFDEARTSAETAAIDPPPNQLPSAAAGADQAVAAGAAVQLDGSGSMDPDGSIATYLWEQLSGSAVALSATDVASPTFPAPSTPAAQDLVFRLTVTDDRGGQAADEVTVAVAAAVLTPVTYRFDTIQALRDFATFMEGLDSGQWGIIAAGSTASSSTGPGTNTSAPMPQRTRREPAIWGSSKTTPRSISPSRASGRPPPDGCSPCACVSRVTTTTRARA